MFSNVCIVSIFDGLCMAHNFEDYSETVCLAKCVWRNTNHVAPVYFVCQ